MFANFVTWQTAERYCQSQGGNLASIANQAEEEFIERLARKEACNIQRGLWIGASDTEVSRTMKWSDGSPFSYTNWGSGEGSSGCVLMANLYSAYLWKDTSCSEQKPYICEKEGTMFYLVFFFFFILDLALKYRILF